MILSEGERNGLIAYKVEKNLHWKDIAIEMSLSETHLFNIVNKNKRFSYQIAGKILVYLVNHGLAYTQELFQFFRDGLAAKKKNEVKERFDLKEGVANFEKEKIKWALGLSNGNKQVAADILCIQRTTLVEKCKRYGFSVNEPNISKNSENNGCTSSENGS